MSLEVQIDEMDSCLSVKAAGQYTLAGLSAVLDTAKEESEKRGSRKVLLDITEVAGPIPFIDRLALGEHCARVWKRALRIAIASRDGGLDKFFEDFTWNRGVVVAVVPTEAAALDWLNRGSSKAPGASDA